MSKRKGHPVSETAQQHHGDFIILLLVDTTPDTFGLFLDRDHTANVIDLVALQPDYWLCRFDPTGRRLAQILPTFESHVLAGERVALGSCEAVMGPTGRVRAGGRCWPTLEAWLQSQKIVEEVPGTLRASLAQNRAEREGGRHD